MDPKKWKRIKRSGAFKRKVQKNYHSLQARTLIKSNKARGQADSEENENGSVSRLNTNVTHSASPLCKTRSGFEAIPCSSFAEVQESCSFSEVEDCYSSSESESEVNNREVTLTENDDFRDHYKKWAIDFNIPHVALKELNVILNKRMPCIVPLDPRTLLKSKRHVPIILIDDGRYWHNGLIEPLKTILQKLNDKPKCVHIHENEKKG